MKKLGKQITDLIEKEKQIEQRQKKFMQKYQSEIKETQKQIAELLIDPIIKYLKKDYPNYRFEIGDDHVGPGKVIVIYNEKGTTEIKYGEHLDIWRNTGMYNNYVRICYTYNLNDKMGLQDLINNLRSSVSFNGYIESKLLQDHETLVTLIEIIDKLRISFLGRIKFEYITYYNDYFTLDVYVNESKEDVYSKIERNHCENIFLNIKKLRNKDE